MKRQKFSYYYDHGCRKNSGTVFFGTESKINLGAKMWNMVPVNTEASESPNIFKSKIKYWTPNHCPCRICNTYIGQVGFINQIFVFVRVHYMLHRIFKIL